MFEMRLNDNNYMGFDQVIYRPLIDRLRLGLKLEYYTLPLLRDERTCLRFCTVETKLEFVKKHTQSRSFVEVGG